MRLILLIMGLLLLTGTSSAWVSGYDYRMPIEINNSGDNLTDYQYSFIIDTAILISTGKMQSDGSDCNITNSTDTPLSWYNENDFNELNTKIWVNATKLGNLTNTTHYIYYGKPDATFSGNGDDTFLFFDDFDNTTGLINYTKILYNVEPLQTAIAAPFQSSILYYNNISYIFYMASNYDDYVLTYNHNTEKFSAPVFITDNPTDHHGYPMPIFDQNGRIHIFYGGHTTAPIYHRYTTNPYNISSWSSAQSMCTYCSYPSAVTNSTGVMYLLHKLHTTDEGTNITKSTDNGSTWSTPVRLIDSGSWWTYHTNIIVDSNDTLHMTWVYDDAGAEPNAFHNVMYAKHWKTDPDDVWRMSNNTQYTLPITTTSAEKIVDSTSVFIAGIVNDSDDNIWILYHNYLSSRASLAFNNGTWNFFDIPYAISNDVNSDRQGMSMCINDSNCLTVFATVNDSGIREVYKFESCDNASTWTQEQITSNLDSGNNRLEYTSSLHSTINNSVEFAWSVDGNLYYYVYPEMITNMGAIDSSKWNTSGNYSVLNSFIRIGGKGTDSWIASKEAFDPPIIIESKAVLGKHHDSIHAISMTDANPTDNLNYITYKIHSTFCPTDIFAYLKLNGVSGAPTSGRCGGTYNNLENVYRIDWINGSYVDWFTNDVKTHYATNQPTITPNSDLHISLRNWVDGHLTTSDWMRARKYTASEPIISLGVEESIAPTVTLLSMTPSIIYKNSTGYLNISYGITHDSSGLNNTSVSFIYRNHDWDLSDSNHSIRPPTNDLASVWNFNGRILRAANRNETPGLNFENNDTITGGDTYTWSGLDENSTKLTIVEVNDTYTIVNINATVHCIMPQMWYLDRTDQQQATKTQLPIHKTQNVLIKFWNFEIYKGNYDFLGVGYTDTSLSSNPALWPSDANPVNFYYVNSSYDPATGGDPITSGYAVYMGSLNASGWVDHVYSRSNSNYVRGFIDNNYLHTIINTTGISYLYFTSNTPSSHPFYINMTNVASSTNVSFANTNTLWAGNTPPYTPQAYTPNIWFAFMKLNMSLDHKLYAADNNDLWGNSTMNRTNITQALFPPTTPTIDHFHFLGETDYDMDGVYYGNFSIGCGVSSDPDGGDVTHNLTLHYANNLTLVTIINNTFTDKDITHNGVYFDANFSSIPYYSQTLNYTLRLIATDDESETVTVWLNKNFSLDGSPWIISYSPETPVSSSEGENQTFSITTNILGNVTWYIDSIEVFNETDVNSSSYSTSNASLGPHNVTVITTNTNGTNSQKWDWTVRTELWAFVEDSISWAISVAHYLVSSIGIVIVTAFSIICILILMMLIGAALSVTRIIYR